MEQPKGYIIPGKEDHVCKLRKGIYGLKQAAKVWNDQLNDLLKENGYIQSKTDPCLYTKRYEGQAIYLIIYVDDILIAAKSVDFINEAANCFVKQFHLTDLGLLKHYLSIEIEKDKDGFYRMKQTKYIQKLLNRFGLEYAKGSNIPLDLGYVKNREGSPPMPKNEKYQQLIGALLYLAVSTRPDISASVAILSQHNKEPTTVDWTEAKRVVRYLKSTIHYELRLGQRDAKKGLIGFADADWAQNKSDRKSNSGYLFKYYGAPISWSCRKQACVALSSTEAEYVALAEASQEGLWIRRLLEDFTGKVQEKTPIYEDNQSCLKLICNNRFNHRTKHIDTKYHFVKELQVQGIMDYQYCPTEQMTADMLTKPLGRIRLKSIAEGCGLTTR
ncbi:Copia protein [Anthophora plagiata]